MKTEIALVLVAFALTGGFLLGRQFPAHHYEPWREARWAYDTTTGKICDPWGVQAKKTGDVFDQLPDNPIDKALAQGSNDPWASVLKTENTHPPCK